MQHVRCAAGGAHGERVTVNARDRVVRHRRAGELRRELRYVGRRELRARQRQCDCSKHRRKGGLRVCARARSAQLRPARAGVRVGMRMWHVKRDRACGVAPQAPQPGRASRRELQEPVRIQHTAYVASGIHAHARR